MHSNLHYELYREMAADRIRQAPNVVIGARRAHPPPFRGRVAYLAGRLANRLDADAARKAVA